MYIYNKNNNDNNYNTSDINNNDYNDDKINHNLVAMQYIKGW